MSSSRAYLIGSQRLARHWPQRPISCVHTCPVVHSTFRGADMSLRIRSLVSIAALAVIAACSSENSLQPSTSTSTSASLNGAGDLQRFAHAKVCPSAAPGEARCHSLVRTVNSGQPLASSGPSGYQPADLQAAYNLAAASASNGASQTIAIVDAYDDPRAESDLAVYRSTFGLPPCTTANGCFRKVNQNG